MEPVRFAQALVWGYSPPCTKRGVSRDPRFMPVSNVNLKQAGISESRRLECQRVKEGERVTQESACSQYRQISRVYAGLLVTQFHLLDIFFRRFLKTLWTTVSAVITQRSDLDVEASGGGYGHRNVCWRQQRRDG